MTPTEHIRATLRQQRRTLPLDAQKNATHALCTHFQTQNFPDTYFQAVGLYLAINGEMDLTPLIEYFQRQNIACYLPILHPVLPHALWFAPYAANCELRRNRYGILETKFEIETLLAPWELSLVLTPLVAFDTAGHRIGMGGGYYDYSFQFRQAPNCTTPVLLGCAYEWQKWHHALPTETWDVTLDGIITDVALHSIRPLT